MISTCPPKSLAWQKGFRLGSGLMWKLLGLWLVGCGLLLLQARLGFCWWSSKGLHGRLPLAAAVLSCKVQPDRWIAPHLAIRTLFDCGRWESWVTQPVHCTSLWPASWLPAVDKTRGSKSVEVQRVWETYDERLQLMSRQDASLLDESLGLDDVSLAWTVWSRAEPALADAFRFSGGPLPT